MILNLGFDKKHACLVLDILWPGKDWDKRLEETGGLDWDKRLEETGGLGSGLKAWRAKLANAPRGLPRGLGI